MVVAPRVTSPSYLSDPFTVEFDFFPKKGGWERAIVFLKAGDREAMVTFGAETETSSFEEGSANQSARYPDKSGEFADRWHHAALVFKAGQLKAYEDRTACW